MTQRVIISQNLEADLASAIEACEHDRIFVLTDTTTREFCWPLVKDFPYLEGAALITIEASDINKSLDSVSHVWEGLQQGGASRHSLLINLGGGMVTDLGGFAASTFKRGINFINIPTTLLAMVDASVGGKTGFNFGGLKNEIGVFNDSRYVILCTEFLKTLDDENIRSGYAEMLKHALINRSDDRVENLQQHLAFDFPLTTGSQLSAPACWLSQSAATERTLNSQLEKSVAIKEAIVEEDPLEHGIRKALNVGHTCGHAFESWAMKREPILHGYAVAWGIIPELYLSCTKVGFPQDVMRQTVRFIKEVYGVLPITCDDYPELLELMTHDKKNQNGIINFTLLGGIGDIRINQAATTEEIKEALDFFREG